MKGNDKSTIAFVLFMLLAIFAITYSVLFIVNDPKPKEEVITPSEPYKDVSLSWLFSAQSIDVIYPESDSSAQDALLTDIPYVEAYVNFDIGKVYISGSGEKDSVITVVGEKEEYSQSTSDGIFQLEIPITAPYFEFSVYATSLSKSSSPAVVVKYPEKAAKLIKSSDRI